MSGEFISKDDLFCGPWTPFRLEILRSPRLSPGAKLLYAELCSYLYQGSAKRAWPSQELLARNLSCNVRTIRRWIDELIAVEVIKVEKIGMGHSNSYWLHRPTPDKLGIYEDTKGRMLPVAVPNADIDVRIGQDTGVLSNADTDVLSDRLSVSAENEISGVSKPSGAWVSAIRVGGEVQVVRSKKREVQVGTVTSFKLTDDKESDVVIDLGDEWRNKFRGDEISYMTLDELDEVAKDYWDSDYLNSNEWKDLSENDKRDLIDYVVRSANKIKEEN